MDIDNYLPFDDAQFVLNKWKEKTLNSHDGHILNSRNKSIGNVKDPKDRKSSK